MAYVAFDTPPAAAPASSHPTARAAVDTRIAPGKRGPTRGHGTSMATRVAVILAALLILSIIAWNVALETGSILIGLGAADMVFLVALSFALSLRNASRSAAHR